jgi:hypothetical protein
MASVDTTLEDPCPSCGALVRRGLVRCWSCGGFMRQDIAARYERMQQRQPEVEFKPLPERGAYAGPGGPAGTVRSGTASVTDDDFEFGGKMDAATAAGEDFELGAQFAPAAADEGSAAISAFSGGNRKAAGQKASDAPTPATPSPAPATAAGTGTEPQQAPPAEARKRPPAEPEGGQAHSIATAGDALLQVALEEEREAARRGRKRSAGFEPTRVSDGWMITCPCPARIRIKVKASHRGKTGKCPNPNCGSYFTVPADLGDDEEQAAASAEVPAAAGVGFPADPADKAGAYTHWITDVRLHVVKPAKAKRKPGGHEKDFKPADLGFSKAAGLAVISLAAKAAGLLAKPKKPEQVREELRTELRAGKPVGELASEAKFTFEPATLAKAIVEFPPAYEHESTFAGVPVFGEGRIAVKLPPAGAPDEQHFVSMTLSQYRRFKELLEGLFEVTQFGLGCPIPSEGDVVTLVCHYSETPMTILRNPAFHLADPETPLEAVGYRCESCGLIVSEESRKKEKIGGLDGKKLASAKCPKCKGKFGKSPLYALKPKEAKPEEQSAAAATAPPATAS